MDLVMIGGAAAGLVMGSFGYVLVRFWCRPVLGYRRLKKRLADLLDKAEQDGALTDNRRDALRRKALALQELVNEVLPHWYKLSLHKKEEQTDEAVGHLQALVNCREPAAIRRRAEAVRRCLRLPAPAAGPRDDA